MELRTFLNYGYNLFDFDYRVDDHFFKEELEQTIIEYFYFHEIGQETPEKFKYVFTAKYRRIIDYYNGLYNTTLLEYNPLINYKLTEALDQLKQTAGTHGTTVGVVGGGGEVTEHVEGREDNLEQDTNTTHKGDENTTHTKDTTNNTTTETNEKDTGTTKTDGTENVTSTTQGTDNTTTSKELTENIATTDNRTDNLKNTNNTSEKRSDYPQQSITSGNYLSGASETDNSGTNTGTVKNEGTRKNNTNESGTTNSTTTSSGNSDVVTTNETIDNREKEITDISGSVTGEIGEGNKQTDETTTGKLTENKTGSTTGKTTTTRNNNEDREETGKTTGKDKTDYQKTIEGLTGRTYQELIRLERENIIRIKEMVINEMKTCFLLVY